MRVLIVGDVGWQDFYHLGDEAMTEMALDELRARGVDDITLVSGDPQHASDRYQVAAVPRVGFRAKRSFNTARRDAVLAHASGGPSLPADDPAGEVLAALEASDAVLVAGGGNLNSMFAQHIYERATIAAVARRLGKPYALTSQTIGPLVYPADRPVLAELLGQAQLAGAREPSTAALLTELGVGQSVLAQGVDDAYGLLASPADHAAVADLATERFVVASFAEKPSTPRISQPDYHALIATTMTQLADRLDCEVLLVPHGGNPQPGGLSRDQVSNAAIAELADHERVVATRMVTAKQLIALTAAATLVIGSRYHAGIFAARVGVPTISLAPNLYSSVRMRGAASNVGMQDFVLDLDSWQHGEAVRAAEELVRRRAEVVDHLAAVRAIRAPELTAWWDGLVSTLSRPDHGSRSGPAVRFAPVPRLSSDRDTLWATSSLLDATERTDRTRQLADWSRTGLESQLDTLRRRTERLTRELAEERARPDPVPTPAPVTESATTVPARRLGARVRTGAGRQLRRVRRQVRQLQR